ncbi:FAD-dependent thymidylate synthase [Candidatus Bathyarchaeota archaeon]|nr:MAG: FAD-dependent thymidylate synthase [Candidatus Hecatellales archaeon]RLI35738.1 MAG: FAD-dependent thymidylate synthase [Candidatus Bathyarchaeota archaeon]
MVKVRLLKYTRGGVKLIAKSARVSGIPESLGDVETVRMIVENDYGSVLEHIYFTFDISEISVALSRELLEHRIASHTARSTRYNLEKGFGFVVPPPIGKHRKLKAFFLQAMRHYRRLYADFYDKMLGAGFSREEALEAARYLLPMAAHTRYVWTVNARALINFLGLRLCVRAAPEMRELAEAIRRLVVKVYPEIFKGVGCRGVNLGCCPENENRPSNCPYIGRIPTRKEVAGRAGG